MIRSVFGRLAYATRPWLGLPSENPAGIRHGIKQLLTQLAKQGFTHCITTSATPEYTGKVLECAGLGQLRTVIAHAFLDDDLHAALLDPVKREALRQALINRYFAKQRQEIMWVVERERQIGLYERQLGRSLNRGRTSTREVAEKEYGAEVRDAGFRRLVTRAYDYRCAACGLRVCLDDGRMLVDAAHLIPFAETQDDDPRNGMALCKNHHWTMDQFLIAPGTDKAWHVSDELDDRLEGQQDLLRLRGRSILLPADDKYYPRKESLQWRTERLSGKN